MARWHPYERGGKNSVGCSEKSCSISFENDEGGTKMNDNEKAILITVKIGENEMKGFVSKLSDKETSNEESLEFYNSTFEGYEQQLALIASRIYTILGKTYKKEEIHTIAEILKVLATAPSFSVD